jgi:hypothetical protein
MIDHKLNHLLEQYHLFCIALIQQIPSDMITDDELLQKAFRFRDDLEALVLQAQINYKNGCIDYFEKEIDTLVKNITNK